MPPTKRFLPHYLAALSAGGPVFSDRTIVYSIRAFACVILMLCGAAVTQAEEVSAQNLPPESAPILNSVIEEARQSATQAYQTDDHELSDALKEMNYQTYRAIRFKADKSLQPNGFYLIIWLHYQPAVRFSVIAQSFIQYAHLRALFLCYAVQQ